ncbi:hypothetical protein [Corynebacterium glyciniphilum]|uniref:hypothetical protein n=1 Tax=Corynebacterium glyciniphilum TaxID=1404244 RepID=UPI003FD154C9
MTTNDRRGIRHRFRRGKAPWKLNTPDTPTARWSVRDHLGETTSRFRVRTGSRKDPG